jgi:hypothetical protein
MYTTTRLGRQDTVQKDPVVNIFQMLGLLMLYRPVKNMSYYGVFGIRSRASMASHPIAAVFCMSLLDQRQGEEEATAPSLLLLRTDQGM